MHDTETRKFSRRAVIQAATSAQTFFSSVEIETKTYMDGCVLAFNPSGIALDRFQAKYGVNEQPCVMLSVGTGYYEKPLTEAEIDKMGYLHWGKPLLTCFLNGQQTHESVQMRMNHLADSTIVDFNLRYRLNIIQPAASPGPEVGPSPFGSVEKSRGGLLEGVLIIWFSFEIWLTNKLVFRLRNWITW